MYINQFSYADFESYLKNSSASFSSPLIKVESAGEGNMNYTFRLVFEGGRSIVIKQAPPYCAKFPDIKAPQQRIEFESTFYSLVMTKDAIRLPDVILFDAKNYIMLMEDLGSAADFTSVYTGAKLEQNMLVNLVSGLSQIHRVRPIKPIDNMQLRLLNHAHIFDIPLQHDNGLVLDDITAGLHEAANCLKQDSALVSEVKQVGERYLAAGEHLLHGDYYPGSWLNCESGIAVIDPEFCYTGAIEFDLGVLVAHLLLSEHDNTLINSVFEYYRPTQDYSKKLVWQFAGCEIMRRLIGYAQLPVQMDVTKKTQMLDLSKRLILNKQA